MRGRGFLLGVLAVASMVAPIGAQADVAAPDLRGGVFEWDKVAGPGGDFRQDVRLIGRFVVGGESWSGIVSMTFTCCEGPPYNTSSFHATNAFGVAFSGTCFLDGGVTPPGYIETWIGRLYCSGSIGGGSDTPFEVVLGPGVATNSIPIRLPDGTTIRPHGGAFSQPV